MTSHQNTDFKVGSLVWAKITKKDPFWPGFVVEAKDCGLEEKIDNDKICVFWIGDDTVSLVSRKNVEDYVSTFKQHYKLKPTRLRRAILESIEIYMERAYDSNAPALSEEMKIRLMLSNDIGGILPPKDNLDLPSRVGLILKKILKLNSDDNEDKHGKSKKIKLSEEQEDDKILRELKQGILKTEEICVVCLKTNVEKSIHPFFTGGLCAPCKLKYQDSLFQMDSMGIKILCIVCGNSEGKFKSREGFLWVFCGICAMKYFNALEKDIRLNWGTYLKNQKVENNFSISLLNVNENWKTNLCHLLYENPDLELKSLRGDCNISGYYLCVSEPTFKEEKLNNDLINLNKDSFKVITLDELKQNSNSITRPVELQTLFVARTCGKKEEWAKMKARPELKEIYVEFFFEFYRVISESNDYMWIYELPAGVLPKFRHLVSRFLNCYPIVSGPIESTNSLNKYRLIWTNLNLTTDDIIALHEYIL